ncbi:MAG: TonB-dependent receptor [Bacteroides sp.]|jgi:outer membrane cobalamin receptor|nr:TonB-dependent receptor [Bacteroides sp.]MCI1682797.1 TonB-dependent receptor [Bacteroides sp.]
MKKHLIHFLLVATLSVFASAAWAQTTVKGQLIDAESGEPLVGASVMVEGTSQGSITDLDGYFKQKVASNATLVFSYIGYKDLKKIITQKGASVDLGVIKMKPDAVLLSDVTITSSIAVARKTPVAVSSVDPVFISEKLSTQEFPEILKSTPGVYASKDNGGFGESRITLRGFGSANVGVMINGVPMNDMEWGGIYWSNWAGLSDVTRSMQVQRGLGASKLSSPSVGGSINIITNSTDAKKGGTVSYGVGNDGYNKMLFSLSSGLTKDGWAFSVLGSKTWGDGYIQGGKFESYSWFINISKRIGDNHSLSLTATGAPQTHNKRYDELTIAEWDKQKRINEGVGYRYNAAFGYDINGNIMTGTSYNSYHKPQISLNHVWQIDRKSSLSSSLYASIGSGYGYRGVGSSYSNLYGASNGIPNTTYRKVDGTFDFASLMKDNAESDNGSIAALAKNMNNHLWLGLLSTYTKQINDYLNLQGGIDLRYYNGKHKAKISNLLGGSYVIDTDRKNVPYKKDDIAWQNERLRVGDVVYRNFDSFITQYGAFGQLEYSRDKLSATVSGNVNAATNSRKDYYYADNEKSPSKTKVGYGIKGGANYNLNANNNIFANIGYYSRTPYFSGGIFLNSQTSNAFNPDCKNENVFSFELGYGYSSKVLSANLNLYRTAWNDRIIQKRLTVSQESSYVYLNGVNELHQGVEFDFKYRPVHSLTITGMFSFGDWTMNKNGVLGYMYDANGQAVDKNLNVVAAGSAEHAKLIMNTKNIKIGNSAQTTAALGVDYDLMEGLRMGIDGNFYGRNYSDYDIAGLISTGALNGDPINVAQPWRIPSAYTFDAHISYRFKVAGLNANWMANCNNLFNEQYVTDATDNGARTGGHGWKDATVFYGFGRTWSMSMKVYF